MRVILESPVMSQVRLASEPSQIAGLEPQRKVTQPQVIAAFRVRRQSDELKRPCDHSSSSVSSESLLCSFSLQTAEAEHREYAAKPADFRQPAKFNSHPESLHWSYKRKARESARAAIRKAAAVVALRQLEFGLPRGWDAKPTGLRTRATNVNSRARTASGRTATPAAERQVGIANRHECITWFLSGNVGGVRSIPQPGRTNRARQKSARESRHRRSRGMPAPDRSRRNVPSGHSQSGPNHRER